jgi:glucosamine kinase
MTAPLLLADLGGTYVRLREVCLNGQAVTELHEVGGGVGDGTMQAEMDELNAVVRRSAIAFSDIPGGLHLVIAARGYGVGHDAMGTVKEVSAFVNAARVTLVPDAVAAYVAALWDRPGVVVTVGTGTVALAVDQSRRVRKLDGWGPQLGDVGSGYRVGLDGLISGCRFEDGRRGGSQMLRDAALGEFGRVQELGSTLRPLAQLRNIAHFAEVVVASARKGDICAGQILDKAARELGELTDDAASLVSDAPTVPVVIGGGFIEAVPELAARLGDWFAANSQYEPLIAPGLSTLDGCHRIGLHGVPEVFGSWVEQIDGPAIRESGPP